MNKVPELLLPVGTIEMAHAAIHNGADAIFIGVPGFNARGRSHDFEIESLKEIITLCHSYRVKVNLAFNILIFESELSKVIELIYKLLPLQPDAFIVQDLGLALIIRSISPEQRIHASTQMTITNYEAIHLLEDLNLQRFVLGRENSIEEINLIRNKTEKEIEVFVHGALCVSYSGQCFTSESLGGRSANRGQCAQSCRFSYELSVDGRILGIEDKKYLVSPQDLCGLGDVSELIQAGVNCFKIEGRLKTPEYVASSAKAYRSQIDHARNNTQMSSQEYHQHIQKMSKTYSRGFFSGWLHGVNHQKLVNGSFSSHRGFEIGKIVSVYNNTLTIEYSDFNLSSTLTPGDGVLACQGTLEQGGFIYNIEKLGFNRETPKMLIEFANDLKFAPELLGGKLYQNHDRDLKKQVQHSITDKDKKKRIEIQVNIQMTFNEPLLVSISDGEYLVCGKSNSSLIEAQSKPLTEDRLHDEFNSLTGTLFKLGSLSIQQSEALQPPLFIPMKEIKNLRQQLIEELTLFRTNTQSLKELKFHSSLSDVNINGWLEEFKSNDQNILKAKHKQNLISQPNFHVLLRDKWQVEDIVLAIKSQKIEESSIDYILLDFEFGRDYEHSLQLLKSNCKIKIGLATTRILKPNEYRNLNYLSQLNPDAILVRNLGALQYLSTKISPQIELFGDFSLNVTNHLTAQYLFQKGLNKVCLSYDLNHLQISDLLSKSDPSRCEITLFQYMPSFHMEHCVFAAFLSKGSSFRDCGKPCEKHDVRLKDQFQNWHQIKADQECRNTMYNAKPQSAARYLTNWCQLGIGTVRYEALKERSHQLISKISSHIEFLKGNINSDELLMSLDTIETYGLNEGPIAKTKEYQSKKRYEDYKI